MSRIWKYGYPLTLLFLIATGGIFMVITGRVEITSSTPSQNLSGDVLSVQIDKHYWSNEQILTIENGVLGSSPVLTQTDVLVLDLTISNRSQNTVGLFCLVRDTQKKFYSPILTRAIKAEEDLNNLLISPAETRTGKLGFHISRTQQSLSLYCSRTEVSIQ